MGENNRFQLKQNPDLHTVERIVEIQLLSAKHKRLLPDVLQNT